ncbi:NAD(P)-binding domain superfamily protein [Fadolivirus algeromassiliense]|jgi:NAD(P)-dependent dehydrogenase (short-subunit alcohol dehydrogenase family)|uniref:NAD(P)-binding domain superfamily protein n=1 Tax=Fadolivirus FV1/VV64 TaxID=3070911 RepID=A0A7D3QUW9_9VIRU|nr:NAD(P)-binding domain superfamily protein [Fadolivirus algeromassiliense]QKF94525.1 NAD(P)-binding domain superfamily protein [Fadolivirus FV1/VV64]
MYRILEPIKINEVFKLNNNELTITELNNFIDFINTNDFNCKNVISFVKHNPNTILNLIYYLPICIFLELYQNYNFIINYISHELYNTILKKTNHRLITKLITGLNYKQELVRLNNHINNIYNFSDIFIMKKLSIIQNKLNFIDWSKFYIGSEWILNTAQKINHMIIKLYPLVNHMHLQNSLDNKTQYFKDGLGQIVCYYDEYVIIIDMNYYNNIGEALFKDIVIFDTMNNDIFCKIETYQKLNEQMITNTIINKDNLIQLKGLKGTFIKYKYNKGSFTYCYVCKKIFDNDITYERYVDMCLDCGKYNYEKRTKNADLSSCQAFVSGIRQKIGLQIALKILRCGGKVIGTSRFPNATHYNYMKQADYNKWKDNLIICYCDFLNIKSVNQLAIFLKTQNINIFINNACQTIKPTDYYYDTLNKLEMLIQYTIPNNLLEYHPELNNNQLIPYNTINLNNKLILYKPINENISNEIIIVTNEIKNNNILLNQFNDIKDLNIKDKSSWSQNIDDIDPAEIIESTIINQTVPTLLISQIKKYMAKPKFIIQVTALEGRFDTEKQSTHAHTNMCKSAMNMLIRTIAEEKELDQYVYSINPSFVSGVNPQNDHYPLSDEDGAARILFPIIEYYNGTPIPKDWIHIRNFKNESW